MIRFIQYLKEYRDPTLGIDHGKQWHSKPLSDRPLSIFTKSAGYDRDWNKFPKEYNPNHDALVHTTEHFPVGGMIQTRGHAERDRPFELHDPKVGRETIHFTRNGLVTGHQAGWFVDMPFTIIAPQAGLHHRLLSAADQDSMVFGNVHLPHGSRVIVHDKFMTDDHRKHLTDLLKAKDWNEASAKIKTGKTYVNFGGRQIKLLSVKPNQTMEHAVHSELRRLGITPLQIGTYKSHGYAQPSDKKIAAQEPEISPQTGIRHKLSTPTIGEQPSTDLGNMRREATRATWPHSGHHSSASSMEFFKPEHAGEPRQWESWWHGQVKDPIPQLNNPQSQEAIHRMLRYVNTARQAYSANPNASEIVRKSMERSSREESAKRKAWRAANPGRNP